MRYFCLFGSDSQDGIKIKNTKFHQNCELDLELYRGRQNCGPRVARMLQASWGRRGKQQQEQNSPNHVQTIISGSVCSFSNSILGPFIRPKLRQASTEPEKSLCTWFGDFVPAVAYLFCLNLPAAFSQPHTKTFLGSVHVQIQVLSDNYVSQYVCLFL